MQSTHSNISSVFSVINMKIAETATSFLASWGIYWDSVPSAYRYNT